MPLATILNYLIVFICGYALGVITTPLFVWVRDMANDKIKTSDDMKKLQLILGVIIFVFLTLINAFVKEVPIWYMAFPAFLIGLDPTKFIKK